MPGLFGSGHLSLAGSHRVSVPDRIRSLRREERRDVVALGAALVDVLANVAMEVPEELDLAKGRMTLVDADTARRIHATIGDSQAASGGSAANTAACLAQMGASVGFVGKVAADEYGDLFARDIRAAGVEFTVPPLPVASGHATGRSLVLVTPDSDRTMCTELGASLRLGAEDVQAENIARSAILYLESYLLDSPCNAQAFEEAARLARSAGTAIALSLSDPGCVERHRDRLRGLLAEGVDVLFANEDEALALTGAPSLAAAVAKVQGRVPVAAITRGAEGVIATEGSVAVELPAEPVQELVDTTGAGDLFAAGFLHGLLGGGSIKEAVRKGTCAAGAVVAVLGARPTTDLAKLMAETT